VSASNQATSLSGAIAFAASQSAYDAFVAIGGSSTIDTAKG
jgi:alcohol dehydrogenase class IV